MKERRFIRGGLAVFLFVGVLLLVALPASASTGLNGPIPPAVGDPVGADISPHGGYSATTAYCLQCHNIHGSNGEYALMYKTNVTDTCNTCHGLFGGAPTGARTPVGAPPKIPGTAAQRTAYDVAAPASGHAIGTASSPFPDGVVATESDWAYNWKASLDAGTFPNAVTPAGPGTSDDVIGGLYCASCHTPHGTWGQAVNTKWVWSADETGVASTSTKRTWADGTFIWWENRSAATGGTQLGLRPGDPGPCQNKADPLSAPVGGGYNVANYCVGAGQAGYVYLHNLGTAIAPRWQGCLAELAAPYNTYNAATSTCQDLLVLDREGQVVSLFGYKLLSMYPNHQYSKVKSWGTDRRRRDESVWCGTCHPSRLDVTLGGTYHAHPTACDYCHGNPTPAANTDRDFPHSSSMDMLLKDYPDALCITCHTQGNVP